ncbi:MAG: tripartite tricarboxylate transporter substrate binding protein [Burkholderiales bacterium]
MKRAFAAAAMSLAALGSTGVLAQTQITRPIRFIVPYVPGGGTDTLTRLLGPFISDEFGQQVIVDNRAGGSSTIGTQIVARANPDGHTIGMIDAAFLVNPSLIGKLPYATPQDFAPVVLVATAPLVLAVNPGVKANTVKELVALAKAQPGKLSFGSAGNGTAVHLAGEQLRSAAGIDLVHIPYKGAGQSVVDVLGGQLTMVFMTQSVAKGHHATGKLRALAITSPRRTQVMPEIATFTEAGYPAVDAATINGILAPAGTPRDFVLRLNGVVNKALKTPELQGKLADLGFESAGGTPEQFAAWIRTELVKWGKVVKDSGAKAEL